MGTELLRRGVSLAGRAWSAVALSTSPALVRAIHVDYLMCGCDVLTANTFRTTPGVFGVCSDQGRASTCLAVSLAREASEAAGRPAIIAGSLAPARDCYRPDLVPDPTTLREEHAHMVSWLAAAAPDLILLETFNAAREAVIATELAAKTDLPVWTAFVTGGSGQKTLSGDPLGNAAASVVQAGARAVGVNCVSPMAALAALKLLDKCELGVPLLVYANGGTAATLAQGADGSSKTPPWRPDPTLTAKVYASAARDWMAAGATVVGGCCGTSPKQMGAVRQIIDNWDAPA